MNFLFTAVLLASMAQAKEFNVLDAKEARIDHISSGESFRLDRSGVAILSFSPDLSRVALIYAVQDKESLASGGRRSSVYDRISWPAFSSDSRHLYATARLEPPGGPEKYVMLVDLKENGSFNDYVDSPFFSKGGRAAWMVKAGNKQALVIDGVQGPWFDGFGSDPVFNPATGVVGYLRQYNGSWSVVEGANESPVRCHDGSGNPVLGYDASGRRFVFGSKKDGRQCLEIDGIADTTYERFVRIQTPNEGGVAYVGVRGGAQYVVTADGEHGPFDQVFYLSLSDPKPLWVASHDGAIYAATPDAEFEVADRSASCSASEDGGHIACLVPSGATGQTLAFDGQEAASGTPHPAWPSGLSVDASGRFAVYRVVGAEKNSVAIYDSKTGKMYQSPSYINVYDLRFSDGEVRFGAVKNRDFLRAAVKLPE